MPGYGPGMSSDMDERQRVAERTRAAMEFRHNMAQGIPNMGGFDPSDLMARPEMRQAETRNQAAMVSDPYREANMKAAEKTNPMNAESQNPGKMFLMRFIGK
jgi:hypothetical protein